MSTVLVVTKHAAARAQQRGIPPLIDEWLDIAGEVEHVGKGLTRCWFSKKSKRCLERRFGREPVRRMGDWLNAYKIVGEDGVPITFARRTRHHRR